MRTLYELHISADPLVRVIHGLPISWDPSIASTQFSDDIGLVVWSPCSRLIAIILESHYKIVILDAVTLEQLYTMHRKRRTWTRGAFSPDSCLLTICSESGFIVTWDLQTGGLISDIFIKCTGWCGSISYSKCGTMIGCLFHQKIVICNVISGTHIFSYSFQQPIVEIIWAHGRCLQFAIAESRSIIIYELNFTSSHVPTRVSSLSTPDNFSTEGLVLLPALSRLAFLSQGRVLVWDAQYHNLLLDSVDIQNLICISFSADGRFLVCATGDLELYSWEETLDGYLLHQKFISGNRRGWPSMSPNGHSMISVQGTMIQLWPIITFHSSSPSIPTQAHERSIDFLLEYSPDELLVAFTHRLSSTVIVLDAKSGNTQSVINAGTKVCGLRLTEDKIVVIGDGMLIAWSLSMGDCTVSAKKDMDNSIQITTLELSVPVERAYASISPDLGYFAFGDLQNGDLHICSINGGNELIVSGSEGYWTGFSSDGSEVWCSSGPDEANQWTIVKRDESDAIKLEPLANAGKLPDGFPFQPPHGYKITDDQWILNPSGRQLVKLPYYLQGSKILWNGKFLRVINTSSQELIVLKLEV